MFTKKLSECFQHVRITATTISIPNTLPFPLFDNRGVFHKAGLRESLAYLDKSGSFKREFRSTNVAYLNAS